MKLLKNKLNIKITSNSYIKKDYSNFTHKK